MENSGLLEAGVPAPPQREALPSIFNLQPSIFHLQRSALPRYPVVRKPDAIALIEKISPSGNGPPPPAARHERSMSTC